MIFKQQLELLMNKKGVNPTILSRMTGVPRQNFTNWLSGQKPKDLDQVDKVANYFGVTLDYLLFGRENRNNMEIGLASGFYEIQIIRKLNEKTK